MRKKPKDHGTKSKVEGGDVKNKHILLIEDLVTTGQSSLGGVETMRAEGAIVNHCFVIVTYGFAEAKEAFEKAEVQLHSLTSFPVILREAEAAGKISSDEKSEITAWLNNPHEWRN